MSFSKFTEKDYEVIARDYAGLEEVARKRCANEKEMAVVHKAFEFANDAHKNVRRRSGEPYMLHPIAVAKIVVTEIGLGYKSITAALLHDVVEDTDYTIEDLKNLFGDKIASLVDGLTKMKNVLDNEEKNKQNKIHSASLQAENFKRILLTLNDDVRVVLIKLADRLHNCRTIEFMPEYKRDKILSETMFIFIPLAHRLGLYGVKSEMENIWLRFKEPSSYNSITSKINRDISRKTTEINEFTKPIDDILKQYGFNFKIKKRVKTPYSIWKKMKNKNINFDQVYDLYAIRIVFEANPNSTESERDQCYHIFSIITGIYKYKPDRIRDWVKHPKANGYEALHCTLMSQYGTWIEVQIRTQRMDDIAEKGIAAHWAYKKDGYISENDNAMDKWLAKVKEILVSPDVNALELLDIIHTDLTTTDIMIFTPKGEQRSIEKGSTALDFAYLVHTEIGNKAIAAKINKKLVPLSQVLRTGDQVEIITAEDEKPKREWLFFVKTRHARNVIMNFFKNDSQASIEYGKNLLKTHIEKFNLKITNELLSGLLDLYDLRKEDELYLKVGIGVVRVSDFDTFLNEFSNAKSTKSSNWSFPWFKKDKKTKGNKIPLTKHGEKYIIDTNNYDETKYVIATCCNPIPGDSVVGFKNEDHDQNSITIHKKTCKIAQGIASKHGDKVVVPEWEDSTGNKAFLVRISIKGVDRLGLLNDISRYISLIMGVNMRKIYLGSEGGIIEGYIDMDVHDKNSLERLIKKIKSIDGITSVIRTDI